jgi:hypothetical protein
MVERVAEAISQAMDRMEGDKPRLLAGLMPWWQAEMRKIARAAIEALQEPTEEMLKEAAWIAGREDVAEDTWKAMLGVALSGAADRPT